MKTTALKRRNSRMVDETSTTCGESPGSCRSTKMPELESQQVMKAAVTSRLSWFRESLQQT